MKWKNGAWSARSLGAIAVLMVTTTWPVPAQQAGTIRGRVTDGATSQPVVGAQVHVVGTKLGIVTNGAGQYTIAGVPAGVRVVQVQFIGYEVATQRGQQITAGQTTTVDFVLRPSAIELGAVVVSATGRDQAKREIGSAVGVIQVGQVALAPVRTFSDLLQARQPGVTVQMSSGTAGAGSKIRIRGSNSVSLSNSPLVIVDGVRVNDNPQSFELFNGGQQTSRLNDFSPADIETVEILKGPSAAALYGTAAANGVIQIVTKRGRAGESQWRFWSEGSTIDRNLHFPDNVFAVQNRSTGPFRCDNLRRAAGTCTISEILRFNPLEDESSTPFRDARGSRLGVSVAGGGDASTFYVSAETSKNPGVIEENDASQVNLRANLTGRLNDKLTLAAQAGYVDSETRFPQNDNSGIGILTTGQVGVPTPNNITNNNGYELPRAYAFAWDNFQDLTRFTGSVQANWRPLAWLGVNAVAGLDEVNRHDNDLVPPGVLELFGPPFSIGFRESIKLTTANYTGNGDASATFSLSPDIASTTSIGIQYHRERTQSISASGTGLAPGTSSLNGTSSDFQVDEVNVENITLGAYAQEQIAWRDRVFLNGAVRGDRNSAFGTNLGWIWYPALSASWVISQEPFFPAVPSLGSLRLRAAWGQSGLRPGFRDAVQFFESVTAALASGEEPGFVISGAGNPDLKPERSTEIELGLDAGFAGDRVGFELTWYNKQSRDALINRPLPPSLGASAARFENIGKVENKGFEAALSVTPVRTARVEWSLNAAASTNDNKLTEMDADDIIFGLDGTAQRMRTGFPLGAYFQPRIVDFNDANSDGVITPAEVTVGDSAEYIGPSLPTREFSLSTTVNLLRRVRLQALLDHKGGHKLVNITRMNRCTATNAVCPERHLPDASLRSQAEVAAYLQVQSLAGFIEDADFWKLREVSVTFTAPDAWARAFRGRSANLTLAARNLHTWTKYSGLDPEVSWQGQTNFSAGDGATLPAFRMFVARIDLSF